MRIKYCGFFFDNARNPTSKGDPEDQKNVEMR